MFRQRKLGIQQKNTACLRIGSLVHQSIFLCVTEEASQQGTSCYEQKLSQQNKSKTEEMRQIYSAMSMLAKITDQLKAIGIKKKGQREGTLIYPKLE